VGHQGPNGQEKAGFKPAFFVKPGPASRVLVLNGDAHAPVARVARVFGVEGVGIGHAFNL
jgi:hypothetical protein